MIVIGIIICIELLALILSILLVWRAILGKSSVLLSLMPYFVANTRELKTFGKSVDSLKQNLTRLGANINELSDLIKYSNNDSVKGDT